MLVCATNAGGIVRAVLDDKRLLGCIEPATAMQ
jgi:hypothetical protein